MTTVVVSEETIDIITIGTQGPAGSAGAAGATGAAGQGVATGGTTGQALRKASNTNYDTEWFTPNAGTVTTMSVASANGFAGSVSNATTTPAVTLSTSVTGMLKGNGTAISAASAGTDYVVPAGNVATATALATGRTISVSGDMSYTSPSFDGSGNVTAAGTLATVNSNVGSYTNANITVNAKGLITAASNGSGGGGSPGGSTTQVQYNSSGSFAGSSTFTYASNVIYVGSATTSFSGIVPLGGVFATDTTSGQNIVAVKSSTDGNAPTLMFAKSRGTNASPSIVSNGDSVMNLLMRGYDGANYVNCASITASVDGSPGTTDMPGRIMFNTAPDGSSTVAERVRIDSSGNVGIGATSISARLHTISTTEQQRTGYDTSNYMSKTISSSGSVTFNLVGTTPGYTFNSGGTTLLSLDSSGAMYGYIAKLNDQTGTTYTLDTTADRGKILTVSNASAITVTLPNSAAIGYCITVYQKGAGAITFSAASGATLRNRQSHTKTAGLYATVTLFVESNSGGSAAVWVLAGDTGA